MHTSATSLLALLNAQISEAQPVVQARSKTKRRAFERDYTAELIKTALLTHGKQRFDDLLHTIWTLDNEAVNHLVVSVFYERFSGKLARNDEHNVCYPLISNRELTAVSPCDMPDTGSAKMTTLYLLAGHGDGLHQTVLLQAVYDREQNDIATRVAMWELSRSGEVTMDNRGVY